MTQLDELVNAVKGYHPGADIDAVRRAYQFAAKAHEGQTRRSGDPYVSHPLAVAGIIAELKLDVASICASLLHDAVEDTSATVEELTEHFGEEVAFLVDGVTKLGKLPYNTREERQAENFRKMLLAMARDIRVILLKFCDRLDNMRTLNHLPPEKWERIASETMQIYAPLAHRLGIQWIKCELEDLSFKYLDPEEYNELDRDLANSKAERDEYIRKVEEFIRQEIAWHGIDCEVSGRAKHLWSIRQKMVRDGRTLEEIHDAIGFRVITDSVQACYGTLGIVHAAWKPIPGRFKDFIALPKPNMYQSLHTAVIGPEGQRIEIQIRTREMHMIAEQGIAAHWKYKEGKAGVADDDEKKFAWLRHMMESQKDLQDPTEFIESVKIELFGDEVYVFTPAGDVRALRKGACPIDFAYTIHSNVGDHCSGARVNGVIVPLRYSLRNGDTVEIITSPNQKPNKDWLKLVKTSRAKTKIRHRLHQAERERASVLGKDLLEKSLRKAHVSFSRAMKQGDLSDVARVLKCNGVEDLVSQVGYGRITPKQVLDAISPEAHERRTGRVGDDVAKNPLREILRRVTRKRNPTGIQVQGEADILVRLAKCCSPLPGDKIVGFITRGRGVTVHRRECNSSDESDPDRRVEVEWDLDARGDHDVTIQVLCLDKPGLLAHMTRSFTDAGVNISQAHCRATDDGRAINTFNARVADLNQLRVVMRALSRIRGVSSVDRVTSAGS